MLKERGYELHWCAPALGGQLPDADREDFAAAVVYGGAQSANGGPPELAFIQDEIAWIRRWVDNDRPYLGFCLGAQLLSRAFGGEVGPHPDGLHEIGYYPIEAATPAFECPQSLVYHWHSEGFSIPEEGELLARGGDFPNQAFRIGSRAYGFQFHPEVTLAQMQRWMNSAGHMLECPGAHSRDRQLEDAQVHNPPLGLWLESFLDRWLADSGLPAARPSEDLVQPRAATN